MSGWDIREHEQSIVQAHERMLSLGITMERMQLIVPDDPIPDERLTHAAKPETCFGMKIVVDRRLPPDVWYISDVQMDRES